MIVLEDRLKELFATLPVINVGGTDYPIVFSFGNKNDLNKFLRQESKKYPLAWLETGYAEDMQKDYLSTDLNLILATYSRDINKENDVRLEDSFKDILIPLLENINKAFERSNITDFKDKNFRMTKFYNYGSNKEHETTDLWDAIKMEVGINVNDDCLKSFSYG